MKILPSRQKTNDYNANNTFLTSTRAGFIISFLVHFAFAMTFYEFFHNIDLQQDGDNITTIALATFQNPSNDENVDNIKPKPVIHKKKHHHKEIFKEYGKLTQKEEFVSNKAPKASPDEKIEDGDVIKTLSYRDGSEDELFSRIKRAIDRKNKYPPMARKRGLEGEVVVEFIIYKDGRVANIRVIKPCPHDPFNIAAMNAIKKAQNDFPILSTTTKIELPITYELTTGSI